MYFWNIPSAPSLIGTCFILSTFFASTSCYRRGSDPEGPVFVYEPRSSVIFSNSSGTAISCTAHGRPAPIMDWVKDDGTPIQEVDDILHILPNNTLYFPPFPGDRFSKDVHTAKYRCTAQNTAGKIISRLVHVSAVLSDQSNSYSVILNDVYVMRGGTAVFRCDIYPTYIRSYIRVVRWTKGTKSVSSGGRFSILQNGEFHLRDVRDLDGDMGTSGEYAAYRCVTRNILTGDERTSKFAYLHVHDPPAGGSAPVIQSSDKTRKIEVRELETSELPCVADGYPFPTYNWKKDGRPIVIDNFRLSQNGGNLIINHTGVSDSGLYICTATNDHGKVSASTNVTVTATLAASIQPDFQVVDAGHIAVFNCSVFGNPVQEVKWYHNGELLEHSSRISIKSDAVLQIGEVSGPDEGMYQCEVSNEKESAQGTSQLLLGVAKPSLLETFDDVRLQPGSFVSMKCVASGNPKPEITWSRDGEIVMSSARLSLSIDYTGDGNIVSYVNVTNIRVQDGGEYRCSATNSVGEAVHTGRVDVFGAPFIRPMTNVTATASRSLTIRCYVTGYPIQSLIWLREGSVLPINHRQQVKNGELIVHNVQKWDDNGKYTCQARNAEGKSYSRSVFVYVMEPPVIDSFHFSKRKQGDRVVVSCVVSTGDLPIEITWKKDGKSIRQGESGIRIQKTGPYSSQLSINDASPRHDGNYTCYASNDAASSNYTASFHVDVPPRWVLEPQDSFVVLGDAVKIDCQTTGKPDPMEEWKKATGKEPGNYRPLKFDEEISRGVKRVEQFPNGTLAIRRAREQDHGYYLCHSSNRIGAGLSKVIFLKVHIPAHFENTTLNHTVKKGSNFTIECNAIGDKPISIAWKFDEKEIDFESHRKSLSQSSTDRGKVSRLNIFPVRRFDSGFYVCSTKNLFGNGVLTIQLFVIEPPDAPFDIRLDRTGSRSISLAWKKPYDGNSEITNYLIQYKNTTDSDNWPEDCASVMVPADDLSSTIPGLHPDFSYTLRIRANNSVGLSEPSAKIIVNTDEEAPTGPPTNVTVEAIDSQALNISWQMPALGYRNGDIKGYVIGIKQFNTSTPYKEIKRKVDTHFKPVYIISGLEKFTKYLVNIRAYNSRGAGPTSEDVSVLTLEDVPSQPPQNVVAEPSSSQSITVVWSPPPLYTLHGILQGYKILYKPVRLDEDESDAQFKEVIGLEVTIHGLQKYTNYSIQVLAFTRMGEGVRCAPIYVRTKEDVPSKPGELKAFPESRTSVAVAWRQPVPTNGKLTKYTVYYRKLGVRHDTLHVDVPPTKNSYILSGLHTNYEYAFAVSGSTSVGEGNRTGEVTASPDGTAPARITNFPVVMIVPWKQTVLLPCDTVGNIPIKRSWKFRDHSVRGSARVSELRNGSLLIDSVEDSDDGNYTCRAENRYGSDEVVVALRVRVRADIPTAPKSPALTLAATTSSTVQVNWLSGSNGGSPIKGFLLSYRGEHFNWVTQRLGSTNRTYTATSLLCGTTYWFYVEAFNHIGTSQKSNYIKTKTRGERPSEPPESALLAHINITFIDLNMKAWLTGGCSINYFAVKYQVWRDDKWVQVSNHIEPSTEMYRVYDLQPSTSYTMEVTAHTDAGSTASVLRFATLTYTGSTIQPFNVVSGKPQPFYQKIKVMVPLTIGVIIFSLLSVIFVLYCRGRRERKQYKDNSSNLRRDLTVETSLMNDLDKRNVDLDAFDDSPETVTKRNVNLLVSLQSDESIPDNSQSWLIHDTSKTTSDNSVTSRSDEESNLHPYASYNLANELVEQQQQQQHDDSPEEDIVAIEKEQAHREMVIESPAVYGQIVFPKRNDDYVQMPLMPPVPTRLPPLTEGEPLPPKPLSDGKEGYENPSVILSPRKYASVDQIHALFTTNPARPHSAYSRATTCKSASRGTGSHGRHSALSSVTTVSSSRDELLQAYENAKILAQPPSSGSPLPYEALPSSGNSQATDNSGATEPGIRKFTQSPPQPNEQREAACEIPVYEQKRRHEIDDGESDTTECEWRVTQPRSPPRRSRGKRGKQRGHVSGKRQLSQQTYSRAPSRTSTTSSTSEEVTYTFGGRQSPNRCTSPSEGYLSYPHDSHVFTDSDFDAVANHPTVVKKKARRSPRSPPQYDILLPTTPGAAAEEGKPLVASVIQPGINSPHHMEEETSVSLLDRYYRTVPPETDAQSKLGERDEDKGYSDDYTVV
ncbi:cell adhesion molecule Dscam1-like [Liolophura sinensis]|uniref:cell adhesion molecule Dscam1-like n=1 Tax=Liolophura sinensis TaxID=3198878 RepID=UPI00315840A8